MRAAPNNMVASNFMENPDIVRAIEKVVPVTMPPKPGSLGFDIPLWVGLGVVGLWAALDGFSERAGLPRQQCATCGRRCIPERFATYVRDSEGRSLQELEDLRHLYAHNYAEKADDVYFKRPRHVLALGTARQLTCGAQFDGWGVRLDLCHLRMYSHTVQSVLRHFHEK
jgi:hypothetical protein